MENRKPWHEDDAYWETFGPMMFAPHRWEMAPGEVEQIIALTGIEPGCRVLDLCCGPGRPRLAPAERFDLTDENLIEGGPAATRTLPPQ
jgi:hypothetical protein